MASVGITYTWGKHQSLNVEIFTEDSYPDALNQSVAEATRALAVSLVAMTAIERRTGDLTT